MPKNQEKTVLIISSSPRKGGNTERLCDSFAKGAKAAGHKVQKVRLAEKTIGFCTGCYACQKGKCPQKDDAARILSKMLAADVIVLSTPVYFYTMTAQLKALIDRSVAVYPNIKNKTFCYIMAMADTKKKMFKGTVEALNGFLACCEGSTVAGMIQVPGVYEKDDILGNPALDEAYEAGFRL
ncbi:MAG: flavodoxin family protein [Thermoguttaceae bacterium]|nr:flavodoxin family protein [Thermoguttaceae bacterium]